MSDSTTPTPEPVAVGTVFIDQATGDVYRLRSYRPAFLSKTNPETGDPDYAIHYLNGQSSMTGYLPATAEVIWSPPA